MVADHRPVLLGMNNPYSEQPGHALYPHPPQSAGARMQRFSGLSKGAYLSIFDRRNLLVGEQWSAARAREIGPALRESLLGRTVVALGAQVNSVMRGGTPHELAPPFRWTPDGAGGWIARVPHPSGRSTFYNDELGRECLAIFLQELAQEYEKWSKRTSAGA